MIGLAQRYEVSRGETGLSLKRRGVALSGKARCNKPMSRLTKLEPTLNTLDTRQGVSTIQRIRGRALDTIRKRIMARDEYTCQICGRVTRALEVDHIVPLHLGGAEDDSNRQAICIPCHREKSSMEGERRGI
jgi:5-methylcytosine-specific restriction endonuclease McrA